MYKIIDNDGFVRGELRDLNSAMEVAKYINEFVTIQGKDFEVCGLFGADSVESGVLPDGHDYDWKKRRI
jgi:hypothetical protein